MKFIYVDESGGRETGDIFVMCGLMVDAYKLRKITADVSEHLTQLFDKHPGENFELKTNKFIEGKGGWKNVDMTERKEQLRSLIDNALQSGAEVYAIGISFDSFDKEMKMGSLQPFGKSYWVGAAMFISARVQRQMQGHARNKGHTVFIVDDNKQETSKLSDELFRSDPWYDGLYQIQVNVRKKRKWIPRKANDRFDQIINTAFGIKSNNSTLIQVADAMSYVYRRHLELQNGQEKYTDEKSFIDQLVSIMDWRRKTVGLVPPDTPSVEFYHRIKHPNWKL